MYLNVHFSFSSDVSSSSSCCAASTDIPDPISPLLPIIHRLWQVFRENKKITCNPFHLASLFVMKYYINKTDSQ